VGRRIKRDAHTAVICSALLMDKRLWNHHKFFLAIAISNDGRTAQLHLARRPDTFTFGQLPTI
jgi:hypothetical protein